MLTQNFVRIRRYLIASTLVAALLPDLHPSLAHDCPEGRVYFHDSHGVSIPFSTQYKNNLCYLVGANDEEILNQLKKNEKLLEVINDKLWYLVNRAH